MTTDQTAEALRAHTLARLLVSHAILPDEAVDDPSGYDGGLTMVRVARLAAALSAQAQPAPAVPAVPSDAEIVLLAEQHRNARLHGRAETSFEFGVWSLYAFARALLSRYGAPAAADSAGRPAGEAVGEQAAFEAWASRPPLPLVLARHAHGGYRDLGTWALWRCWQARAALATPCALASEPIPDAPAVPSDAEIDALAREFGDVIDAGRGRISYEFDGHGLRALLSRYGAPAAQPAADRQALAHALRGCVEALKAAFQAPIGRPLGVGERLNIERAYYIARAALDGAPAREPSDEEIIALWSGLNPEFGETAQSLRKRFARAVRAWPGEAK